MTVRPVHLLLLLAPALGCMKPNSASLEVTSICSPPDPVACSFSSTCDSQTLVNQTVDLGLTADLFLPVEVHNQMANNADTSGHVNTNDALVQQVAVSYEVPGFAVGSITTNIQQSVPANGTAVLGLDLLNQNAATAFGSGLGVGGSVEAIFSVKLKGVLGDGSKFETGSYRVPVTVCQGCLAGAYVCDDPTQTPTKFCPQDGQWPVTFSCGAAGTTFTVGGTIAGLGANTGLRVHCTGLTDVAVPASATNFTFQGGLADGASYTCSIATQPDTPASQACTITANGSGTVSGANVTNITIVCT